MTTNRTFHRGTAPIAAGEDWDAPATGRQRAMMRELGVRQVPTETIASAARGINTEYARRRRVGAEEAC